MEKENEFEKQYNKDEFNDSSDDVLSDDSDFNKEESDESLVDEGDSALEYDISKAPTTTKGPERIDMDGKTITVTDVKLILPKPETEWKKALNTDTRYKTCIFKLFYDNEGQREYYSGIKVFPRKVNGKVKYSAPNIQNNASNQASELKKVYAKYKGKKPEEISLHEFLNFLASKPKAVIESKEFEYDGEKTKKNIIVKFV